MAPRLASQQGKDLPSKSTTSWDAYAYRARVATTDRTAIARPGLGDRESERARPGGRRAEWWRGWFAPAQGLRPRPLDVLVALVIAFVQVAGTIT